MQLSISPALPDNHVSNLVTDDYLSLEGRISEPPDRYPDRTRLYVDLETLYGKTLKSGISGRLMLTIGAPDSKLEFGQKIRFRAKIKKPRNFHNPGGFDYEIFLALKGVFATAFLKDSAGIIIMSDEAGHIRGSIEKIRERIRESVYRNAGDQAPVLLALITGDQAGISRHRREEFSRSGTAHIIAISGEHIGLIAIITYGMLLWLLKHSTKLMLMSNVYKVSAILTIPAVILYTLIAGAGYSIIRAAAAGMVILGAIIFDRRRDVPNLIAVAAFLILMFEPAALFDISFQLSFAAVISISFILPYLENIGKKELIDGIIQDEATFARKFKSFVTKLFFVTSAAIIGTTPLSAFYFNRISLISPFSNMIIVPLTAFISVPVGLLSCIIMPFSDGLSGGMIYVNSMLLSFILQVNSLFAALPFSSFRIVTPSLCEIVVIYIIIILWIIRDRIRYALPVVAILSLLLVISWSYCLTGPRFKKDMTVTYLDTGQGESALIEFPGGKRMLIDGGGLAGTDFDIGERVIAQFLWKKRIGRIDYVVLSHPNYDHYGGLPFIIKNFGVMEVWESSVEEDGAGYVEFRKSIEESGAMHRRVAVGDLFRLGGADIGVIHPPRDYQAVDDRSANNGSMVLRIVFGSISFLFTGDIEEMGEARMVQDGRLTRTTVVKAPHHGSMTSSSTPFVEGTSPSYAIFSAGFNNYLGFPRKEILERYRSVGAEIFRTDLDGAITAVTDGKEISFSTMKQSEDQP